jgi:capsular exopolysaccharide synthesis family protein
MNEQQNTPEELDIRSYFRPVWRRKWIILAIVVLAAGGTYFLSSRQQKSYVASTKVYLEVANPLATLSATASGQSAGAAGVTAQTLADAAQLVTTQQVTREVARRLGMRVSSAGSVTANPDTGSSFITVTATSHKPRLAARLANAYAAAFLFSRQQSVRTAARGSLRAAQAALLSLPNTAQNAQGTNTAGPSNQSQTQSLQQQIQTYKQLVLNPSPGARQIDPAAVPGAPSSPKPARDAIFGGIVGLVLGVIVAFCLELLDRRLVRVSTVESTFGRPVLAVLPHVAEPSPADEAGRGVVPAPFVEELRSLRVMVRLAGNPEPPRTIMITSALPREGKSTLTRDLAIVYAESGERVLVIDADLRRPSMEESFRLEAEKGLVQVLRGETQLSEATIPARLSATVEASSNGGGAVSANGDPRVHGSIDVLTHGERSENPGPLLSSKRMAALLEEASQAYDVVLMDTPPVLTVADGVPLMEMVDSVLLVARLGQTTRQVADRFNELIDRLPTVTFSGVIANDQREKLGDDGYGSYGRYGYGYYSTKRGEGEQTATTSAS